LGAFHLDFPPWDGVRLFQINRLKSEFDFPITGYQSVLSEHLQVVN